MRTCGCSFGVRAKGKERMLIRTCGCSPSLAVTGIEDLID